MDDLHFPPTFKPEGFGALAMVQHDGKPDPVIRELLQNCLDAARATGRATPEEPLEVHLTVRRWPVAEIPGIEAYRHAFETARRQHCEAARPTPATAEAVRRIETVLASEWTEVLFCTDNGHGLNPARMRAILAEGRADNGGHHGSAGSYGVGHLSAFAASDLRYVFYGGRSENGAASSDVVSGHAVLADHEVDGTRRAADGYWAKGGQFDLFDGGFANSLPPILETEMDEIESTGSVVAVIGFNRFGEDRGADRVASEMARVAATNFLVAIRRGEMKIEIDFEDEPEAERVIDQDGLGKVLHEFASRKLGGGWLPGAQAFAAWKTLAEGRELEGLEGGIAIRFRPLTGDPGERTRVNLFRSGMWITNRAPRLATGDFAGQARFDAVVSLDSGPLFDLVRAAEGPEHRGIDRRRLSPGDWKKLNQRLGSLAERLRREAGDLAEEDTFLPEGFAVVHGNSLRSAEEVRLYSPRLPREKSIPEREKRERRERNANRPKAGTRLDVRVALRPVANGNGKIDRLRVRLDAVDSRIGDDSMLGLRVRRDSGSDASCDRPLPPDWLDLRGMQRMGRIAEENDAASFTNGKAAKELVIEPDVSDFQVLLGEPIDDTRGVEVDIVHRRRRTASSSKGAS